MNHLDEQQHTPELTLTPQAWAHGGHTVARTDEGRVVFVRHADVGEQVRVRLTEHDPQAKFWRGDVTEVLTASEHRRQSHPWAAADTVLCAARGQKPVGGAELGHLDLHRQRQIKTEVLNELLGGIGGLPAGELDRLQPSVEALPGEHPLGLQWRTRAHFAVDHNGCIAMHPHRSDDLVAVEDFPLMVPALSALDLAQVDLRGVARVDLAAPSGGSGPLVLVTPGAADDPDLPEHLMNGLITHLQRVSPEASVVLGPAEGSRGTASVLMGRGHTEERLDGLAWRVSAGGFWQIHRQAPATLLHRITQAAAVQHGDTVLDLYSGAGLFTAALAQAAGPSGGVVAIEGSPVTSADAAATFAQVPQVEVVRGDVEQRLAQIWPDRVRAPRKRPRTGAARGRRGGRGADLQAGGHGKFTGRAAPDVVVLDPPRSGAGKPVVDAIHALAPERVVYLSCDPATLARDLARFTHHGWQIQSVTGFDLYPNTHHMETLVVLTR